MAVVVVLLLVVGSAAGYFVFRPHGGQATENAASVGQLSGTIAATPAPDGTPTAPPASTQRTAETPTPAPAPKPEPAAPKSTAPAPTPAAPANSAPVAVAPTPTPTPAPPVQEAPPPMPFVASQTTIEVVRIPALNYPEVAMRNRIEGRVVVEVTVDGTGKPVETRVLKSDNELLDDSAIEAAMNATFKPATMNDAPVTSKVSIPFNFRLKK
jgi:TonB family protein